MQLLTLFNICSLIFKNMQKLLAIVLLLFSSYTIMFAQQTIVQSTSHSNTEHQHSKSAYAAYLFVYFTGNDKSEEAIHYALSNDGYHFWALNNDKPVISSAQISSTGGVRDPHILRGADGKT